MNDTHRPDSRTPVKRLLRRTETPAGWGAAALFDLQVLFMVSRRTHCRSRLYSYAGTGFFAIPLHAATIPAAGTAAIFAGLLELFALTRHGERSVLVIIPLVLDLVIAWFVVGALAAPHRRVERGR